MPLRRGRNIALYASNYFADRLEELASEKNTSISKLIRDTMKDRWGIYESKEEQKEKEGVTYE
jgi:hypothetical protein|tara:strand:- start:183 stop:371 length:189 start_codon:yes stop_codon:yes gene_type:complete